MDNFGSSLKKRRKEKGFKQKDLALQLGVGQTSIANYESNSRFPNEEILRRLSNVLDISMDDLLGTRPIKDSPTKQENIPQMVESFVMALVKGGEDDKGIAIVMDLAKSGYDVISIYEGFLKKSLVPNW